MYRSLEASQETDGSSLFDHTCLAYGSSIHSIHYLDNCPTIVTGGGAGIKRCIENLRLRCPQSQIVLVKILPAFDPRKEVGAKVREINAALDALKLDTDAHVYILDLRSEFTNADGPLKRELYSDGPLHLGPPGCMVFAGRLKPLLNNWLGSR